MNNRLLRPLMDAVRQVYLFLFTRGQDQVVTQSGDLLRAEQTTQSDIYGAGLPVTITELPSGTASADMVLAVDNATATITQKITLGSIPGLAPPQAHTHDDRYYTETEVNSFLAGKSDTTHTHSAATTTVAGFLSAADKTKLDGIASNATANSTDAQLRDRSTHTGTQAATTITGLSTVATSGSYTDLSNRPATFPPSAHTHPTSDITGLGTIATQNATSVAITGGSINGTTIGATTASTGAFTTVTTTGNVTVGITAIVGGRYFDISNTDTTLNSAVVQRFITRNAANTGNTTVDFVKYNSGPFYIVNNEGAMYFGTGGVGERIALLANGNVGIGTASPAANLDVAASVPQVRVSSTGGATGQLLADGSSFYVGPTGAHALRLQTNGTTRAIIDSTGNVGIGTTSPGQRLHVAGSGQGIFIEDTGANRAVLSLTASNTELRIQGTAYVNAAQPLTIWTTNEERMRITATGNVGIGTASPQNRLHVDSASNFSPLSVGGSDAVSGIQFRNTGATLGYIYYDTTPSMIFQVAASEKMRILTNGNVGIGTASPTRALHVVASDFFAARISSTSTVATVLEVHNAAATWELGVNGSTGTTGAAGTFYLWQTGVGARMAVTSTGNVGIGAASPAISSGIGLHISGSTIRLGTARTPASSTATGNTGEICWDSSFLYVCVATNSWRRIALSTF